MWDTKRQLIWVAAGLALGTLVFYGEAHDEAGKFDSGYFALLEFLLVIVITIMFYIYARPKK
jgi:hypothetical protein